MEIDVPLTYFELICSVTVGRNDQEQCRVQCFSQVGIQGMELGTHGEKWPQISDSLLPDTVRNLRSTTQPGKLKAA